MSESAGNIGNGSLLIVHGFSFGDKHIVHALKRALENRELLVIIVAYTDNDVEVIKRNLKDLAERKNLRFLCPKTFLSMEGNLVDWTLITLIKLLPEN